MPAAAPPHTSRWEWMQCALLAANLGWTTLCLGGFRPETMVVTATLTTALLMVHFAAAAWSGATEVGAVPSHARIHPAGWLFLPFLAYAAINAAWITPVPWLGWRDVFLWTQLIAVFWVVLNGLHARTVQRMLFGTLVALAVVGVVMACYQRFVDQSWLMLGRTQSEYYVGVSGPFGIPNSFAALLLLVLPACGALAFRPGASAAQRVWWGWLAAVLALGLLLTLSRGAWLSLALALCAWPLVRAGGRWARRAVLAVVVLAGVVAVGVVVYEFSPRAQARVAALVRDSGEVTRPVMWRGAWQLFHEHPAWGSGAGSYDVLFERVRPEHFQQRPRWVHNDYLNTLSDYGAVGFGLFFGAAAIVVLRSRWGGKRAETGLANTAARSTGPAPIRRAGGVESRLVTEALAVGLLAFAVQLGVDFHFKIPALGLAFVTVAGIVVSRSWLVDTSAVNALAAPGPAAKWLRGALVGAVLGGGAFFAVPHFRAEALRLRARERIDGLAQVAPDSPAYREALAASRAELARAVRLDRSNAQAWADHAYAAALLAYVAPTELPSLAAEARRVADRAVELAPVSAEFWVRRGVAQDMQGRWFEGSLDFSQATVLAPHAAWTWYYLADHLSQRTTERGRAEAALAVCLRLDPFLPEALALRQRLAISLKAFP